MPQKHDSSTYHVTISKQELALLPTMHYKGRIQVVDRPEDVETAIAELRNESVIGFDTETRPCFKKGQSHKVALMQLSSHEKSFLFRVNIIGIPDALRLLLEDTTITKIGLSIHDDFHNIRELSANVNPQGFIDLQPFVKDYLISDNSLARIYGILFGKRISKSQQLSNWEAQRLTPGQQAYASLDAMACLHIYDYITSGAFVPDESPYYQPIPQEEAE